jgi:hypothetical protein
MAKVKKGTAKVEGTTLTIDFTHGEELTLDANELSGEMKTQALMHGLKQKVCDSYASAASPEEALERASAVVQNLLENNWNVRGGGEGGTRVTQLAQALATVTGRSIEEAVELVSEMDDDKKKNLSSHPAIRKAVAAIQEEKARKAREEAEAAEGDSQLSIEDMLEGSADDE